MEDISTNAQVSRLRITEVINGNRLNGDIQAEDLELVRRLLELMGEDPARPGLRETPARLIRLLKEMASTETFKMTTFDAEGYDQMIVESGIPFYSLCEHHVVPFFGAATIAYVPDRKIVGLSKLPRALAHFSRGLQNQERITQNVANLLERSLKPKGVAVILRARHMCMEMRGARAAGAETTTSALKGVFQDSTVRQELMALR